MQYISSKEFLKQDEKVQKVFLDWWKPSEGDLYYKKCLNVGTTEWYEILACFEDKGCLKANLTPKMQKHIICPLLTEGQLRQFIEDKTSGTIDTTKENSEEYLITIWYAKGKELFNYYKFYKVKANNLFQAYWKVALEIAKEEIN